MGPGHDGRSPWGQGKTAPGSRGFEEVLKVCQECVSRLVEFAQDSEGDAAEEDLRRHSGAKVGMSVDCDPPGFRRDPRLSLKPCRRKASVS